MTADAPPDVLGSCDPASGILSTAAGAAPPRTLLDILRSTTLWHPEALALDDGRGALSYRELTARVIATDARLDEESVQQTRSRTCAC
jgi:non-ribosomal peptide synthetase component E (peptide arylation enzyme)